MAQCLHISIALIVSCFKKSVSTITKELNDEKTKYVKIGIRRKGGTTNLDRKLLWIR
jgi:hypothetical protein